MDELSVTDFFLYFILLGSVGLGWALGKFSRNKPPADPSRPFRNLPAKDYFIGLNYLLNDEPDDAIDLFINSLEINSGTLETHMALGTLLRRRGKVDKSITIYQDLLGQNNFSDDELNEIRLNLVQSYIAAGLLDRAESLLEELRKARGQIKVEALIHSVNVYQLEKDWLEGIGAISELLRVCASEERIKYQNLASHFYCELAVVELENEHMTKARDFLHLAADLDKKNVRVNMLQGRLEHNCGNFQQAIKCYSQIKKQDSAFMADVFQSLIECYGKAGKEKALEKFIEGCLQDETNTAVLLELSTYLQQKNGAQEASLFLLKQLQRKPSLRLMLQSISIGQENNDENALYKQVLSKHIENKAQYQCVNCGFELKSLHWQCPGCSQWGTVKHVVGLLSE